MPKPLSNDLRERVVAFVEAGHSRRAAAAHFLVSPSFVINLMTLFRQTGRVDHRPIGGRRHAKLDQHRAFIVSRIGEKADITMPELADGRLLGAGALQDRGFFDVARQRWRDRWNQESPGDGPSRYGLARAETFLLQSLASAEDGHFAEAVEAARRAAAMEPGKAQYHVHLGGLLARTGDLAGAEAALYEAIGLDAERAGLHHILGHVLLKTGRLDEAIASQRRAIELDASDPRYRAALDNLIRRRPS